MIRINLQFVTSQSLSKKFGPRRRSIFQIGPVAEKKKIFEILAVGDRRRVEIRRTRLSQRAIYPLNRKMFEKKSVSFRIQTRPPELLGTFDRREYISGPERENTTMH